MPTLVPSKISSVAVAVSEAANVISLPLEVNVTLVPALKFTVFPDVGL